MKGGGDLHVDEEFARAKKNLLWFCSFAILLWMVHVPPDGAFVPPLLGTSARIDVNSLRGAIWIGCLYCFVGFYKQVRNVERINSAAVYTKNLSNIDESLVSLQEKFSGIVENAKFISNHLRTDSPTPVELDHARAKLEATMLEAVREARERFGEAENGLALADRSTSSESSPEAMIQAAIEKEAQMFAMAQGDKMATMSELKHKQDGISETLEEVRSQFHRLSGQIRTDHRFFFTWYDKYLAYSMFALATVASAWPLRPALEAYLPRTVRGGLFAVFAIASLGVIFFTGTRIVTLLGNARRRSKRR